MKAGFYVTWIVFKGECFLRQFASLPNTTAKSFADSKPAAGVLSVLTAAVLIWITD